MQITNAVALKEWAVIIEALLAGRQIILLRKGGISEEGGRFAVDYREFFLYPTYVHQQEVGIKEADRKLLQTMRPPSKGYIELRAYASVTFIAQLKEWEAVAALEPFHIWSAEEIRNRFDRRAPDLTVMALRVFRLTRAIPIQEEERFAGCRSWVTLESSLITDSPMPVLTEKKYLEKLTMVRQALARKGARK